jgi:hypothetical protein
MVILGIRAVRKSVVALELVQEDIRHQNLPLQHHMQGSRRSLLCVLAIKREWEIRSFPILQNQVFLKHAGIKINSSCHLES